MGGMRPFTQLLSFEDALSVVMSNVQPISRTETLSLDELKGRVISENVVSKIDVPSFNRAAMDGYAVIASDTYGASESGPRTLRLAAEVHAGDFAGRELQRGECAQVATGSMLPPRADAVVMVEFTERTEAGVEIRRPIHPGGNISKRGEDVRRGETVLKDGDLITPAKVGVLAALGIDHARVYQKPSIVIIPTGSEVVEVGSERREGQVYDINSHTIAAVVSENGGYPVMWKSVPDLEEALLRSVSEALRYDMLVFSGGSSVGSRDMMGQIFGRRGRVLFHGVQVKPGKPTLFAIVEDKPVFSMPGYPTSCLSNAYLFLVPAVRKVARLSPKREIKVKARLSKRLTCTLGRKQFLTVQLKQGVAVPVFKESAAITSMSAADGYIVIPPNVESLEKDQEVEVTLF